MALYFAYGSNMSGKQMAGRCASARFVGVGVLPEHELGFPRRSRRLGGGAAGIKPSVGKQVEGVVWDMTDADLVTMDGFEGVALNCYWRERVEVVVNGQKIEVAVYYAVAQTGEPFAPHPDYLNTMIVGAKEHGLSQAYIGWLEGIVPV